MTVWARSTLTNAKVGATTFIRMIPGRCHSDERQAVEHKINLLIVIVMYAILLSVIMMSEILLSAILLIDILLNVILLNDTQQNSHSEELFS